MYAHEAEAQLTGTLPKLAATARIAISAQGRQMAAQQPERFGPISSVWPASKLSRPQNERRMI